MENLSLFIVSQTVSQYSKKTKELLQFAVLIFPLAQHRFEDFQKRDAKIRLIVFFKDIVVKNWICDANFWYYNLTTY